MKSTALCALALLAFSSVAAAAPQAHILRIDPTAGVTNGTPILTTVVEVVQFNRLSDALTPCAAITGYDQTLDCWSKAIEKPGALWSPFPFPEANAHFFVNVAGADTLTKFDSKEQWGAVVGKEAGVGTAWLIALDASSGMGARYADARVVAERVHRGDAAERPDGPDDLRRSSAPVRRRLEVEDVRAAQRSRIAVSIEIKSPMPSHGSDRPLFSQIKKMTQDVVRRPREHQGRRRRSRCTRRWSSSATARDAVTLRAFAPTAGVFTQYLDQGRFPADNTSLPKTPLPVISIWFPSVGGYANELYKNNDSQFMQSLANPEIGGFFDIVRGGQGATKAARDHRPREAALQRDVDREVASVVPEPDRQAVVQPRLPEHEPGHRPDGSFKDVPIGVDPTAVAARRRHGEDRRRGRRRTRSIRAGRSGCTATSAGAATRRARRRTSSRRGRAHANANSADPGGREAGDADAHRARTCAGLATDMSDTFADLQRAGRREAARRARATTWSRTSSSTTTRRAGRAGTTPSRSSRSRPGRRRSTSSSIPGIAGGVVVVGLLLVVLMRGGGGGGGGKRRRATTPPARAGRRRRWDRPPYGAPPGRLRVRSSASSRWIGGSPGRRMAKGHRLADNQARWPASPPPGGPDSRSRRDRGGSMGAPGAGRSRFAALRAQMMTMATPGQPSVCFSCGQPLPASADRSGAGRRCGRDPPFPLTGAIAELVPQPPANPYGTRRRDAPPFERGGGGATTRRPVRAVRDPCRAPRCGSGVIPRSAPSSLKEPRVSGVHSTLKFEAAKLWVRDEQSNNGTYRRGARIARRFWTAVPAGRAAPLRADRVRRPSRGLRRG